EELVLAFRQAVDAEADGAAVVPEPPGAGGRGVGGGRSRTVDGVRIRRIVFKTRDIAAAAGEARVEVIGGGIAQNVVAACGFDAEGDGHAGGCTAIRPTKGRRSGGSAEVIPSGL